MADQGSKAAMQTDINAKCTTNGAGENTGTRIRALFTNLLDTLYAAFGLARNVTFTPFVSLQAGTFPGAYRATGLTGDGEPWYKLAGAAGPIDDGNNSIFYQGSNFWEISNATGLVMYQGTGADLLTATWTNTGDGALPLPSLVGIAATDVQAAVEEVAAEVAALDNTVSIDGVGGARIVVLTGSTNSSGEITFDLSSYTTIKLVSGICIDGPALTPAISTPTPAAYTVYFADQDTAPIEGNVVVTFLCIP